MGCSTITRGLAFVALALGTSAAAAQPAIRGALQERVGLLIDRAGIGDARVGVHVSDTLTDRTIVSYAEDESFLPASNMKLVSTGVALSVLGPEFAFRTRVTLVGDEVVLIGDGDPAFGDPLFLGRLEPEVTISELFGVLGREVAARTEGRTLSGVVVDDRVFDREWVPESWPVEQLNMSYAAQVGGVNVHTNVFYVFPSAAAEPGSPPTIEFQPTAPWARVTNRAKTVRSGQHTAWVARPTPRNSYTLFGNVPMNRTVPIRVALHNPPLTAGRLLAEAAADAGVDFEGTGRAYTTARLAEADERIASGILAAEIVTPLFDVVAHCNRASQNMFAEALLKRSGHERTGDPGSWSNGRAVSRMVIGRMMGPSAAAGIRIGDGSGLSRENSTTPRFLTDWLGAISRDASIADAYFASLPAPAEPRTTLRNRFGGVTLETDVRAKSGSINGVRCLSGYVRHRETGRQVAFSILINDLERAHSRSALRLHEAIVDAIDDWLLEEEANSVDSMGG